MRIRGSSNTSFSSHSSNSTFSLAPSTSSFVSSTNSLASSSSNLCSSIDYEETRCEGLDLLVKAVIFVAGSVLGVPFTQKRVIRRRKRALKFRKFIISEFEMKERGEDEDEDEDEEEEEEAKIEVISKPKKRKRVMALPSKYQDSVLQPWKRRTRRTQSMRIDG